MEKFLVYGKEVEEMIIKQMVEEALKVLSGFDREERRKEYVVMLSVPEETYFRKSDERIVLMSPQEYKQYLVFMADHDVMYSVHNFIKVGVIKDMKLSMTLFDEQFNLTYANISGYLNVIYDELTYYAEDGIDALYEYKFNSAEDKCLEIEWPLLEEIALKFGALHESKKPNVYLMSKDDLLNAYSLEELEIVGFHESRKEMVERGMRFILFEIDKEFNMNVLKML